MAGAIAYMVEVFWPALLLKGKEIVLVPKTHHEMFWIATPLLLTLLIMEFYFGRYKEEELGWNSAVGNSLVLFFVSIDLLRFMYAGQEITLAFVSTHAVNTFIGLFVGLLGMWQLSVNFFHIFPKSFAFIVSSSLPINLIAYFSIVFVYGNVLEPATALNINTSFTAVVILLLASWLIFGLLKKLEPTFKQIKSKV